MSDKGYSCSVDFTNGEITIEGQRVFSKMGLRKLQKAGLTGDEVVKDPYNPDIIILLLSKTVSIFDQEMVVSFSFDHERLDMVSFEPADLFNKRNAAKLAGTKVEKKMLEDCYTALKDKLRATIGKDGEESTEDGVVYYFYDMGNYGAMIVKDLNEYKSEFVITFE